MRLLEFDQDAHCLELEARVVVQILTTYTCNSYKVDGNYDGYSPIILVWPKLETELRKLSLIKMLL